jgi:hypothetical protein
LPIFPVLQVVIRLSRISSMSPTPALRSRNTNQSSKDLQLMVNRQPGLSLKLPKAIPPLLLSTPQPRPFLKPLALNPLSSLPIMLEVLEVLVHQHRQPIPLPTSLELVNLEKPPNLYLTQIIPNLFHRSPLPTTFRMLLPLPLPLLQEELQDHRHHLSWSKPILEVLLVLLLVLLVLPVLQLALRPPIWPLQLLLARWVDYGGNLTYPLRLDPILPRESI